MRCVGVQLKSELDTVQGSHGERLGGVERQYEEKLSQARREHSAELAAVTEQLSQLRRQHTSAEDQLLALRYAVLQLTITWLMEIQ
jgi:hypothetical protein